MTLDEVIERYTRNAEYERTHGSLQGCLEFRQLVEWLSALQEYKDVLNKIRAEINAIEISGQIDEHTLFARSADVVKDMVLEIIDKYRNEVNE